MRADNAGRGGRGGRRLTGDDEPSRLADHAGLDPWLAALLRSTGRYKAPPGRKQRVLLGLGRCGPRRAPAALWPAIVVGVLLGCGALASAALGPRGGWLGRTYERLVPRRATLAGLTVAQREGRHRATVAPSPAIAPLGELAQPRPPAAAPMFPPAMRTPNAIVNVHHAGERDTAIVVDGMRALRIDRDPGRARGLLARYLQRHPRGALAEEALALSIEAAVAQHDPAATALAGRYLRQYPAGRFRALAGAALGDESSTR